MSNDHLGTFSTSPVTPPADTATPVPTDLPPSAAASEGLTGTAGRGLIQPPVAYLPCTLDDDGAFADVALVRLDDGRTGLLGYTALDRFVAACGEEHPWVLWRTADLPQLRARRPYDVAYLDVPLPAALRRPAGSAS